MSPGREDFTENRDDLSSKKKEPKKVVWIKKNQIDSTAALTYGLGVSLIHLALFVLACSIERPNLDLEEAN